jgi:DNA mismatch repair protein MutS
MRQYLEMKSGHEDAVLFFRLGDFYEMFFEDAEKAAGILDIALTSRNRNDEHPIPMCGVPYHSARSYIAKLLEAGVKVAICEQLELSRRGIARRAVTRVVTPGTSLDEESLAPDRGNFLAAVVQGEGRWTIAWADFSTGEVRVTDVPHLEQAEDELAAIAPSELLLSPDLDAATADRLASTVPGCLMTRALPEAVSQASTAANVPVVCVPALMTLVSYIERTQGGAAAHLRAATYEPSDDYLRIDRASLQHLELVESAEGGRKGSLLGTIDGSITPMGRRLMREWLLRPLGSVSAIGRRLDAVDCLFDGFALRDDLRSSLAGIGDIERLAGRLGTRTADARDLIRLRDWLEQAGAVRTRLQKENDLPELLSAAAGDLDPLEDMRLSIRQTLVEDPPLAIGRGMTIRDGVDPEVDRLRAVSSDGRGWMAELEAAERARTGIAKLKIGYNKVFGYYIEVSRAAHDKVPADYERKQTVANAERYVTEDLKRREAEVLGAEDRLVALETHLLSGLVSRVASSLAAISRTATALATVDAICGLAERAVAAGYVRPEIHTGIDLEIVGGRHPVVESVLGSRFVPNDCRLSDRDRLVMVITGPNMAGKSTYLRQVALITLLAHVGTFVPATSARIPLVDRIFTRIGASDNLARGQSTFMVEMTETAQILKTMTPRSLVVLDEIGRGTSTFDGISIAWAVAEAMIRMGVKTLFATHYHELAGMAAEFPRAANFSVAVRRYRGEIVFLYRIVEGATSGSYGIEVARLAGVPEEVIANARRMLERFETDPSRAVRRELQSSLFDAAPRAVEPWQGQLVQRLAATEVERLTPLEALNLLDALVRAARDQESC